MQPGRHAQGQSPLRYANYLLQLIA
jgi:hypothetical protein